VPLLESVLSKKNIQAVRPDYEAELNIAVPAGEEKEEGEQHIPKVGDDNDEE
jgi:hypothetical protein